MSDNKETMHPGKTTNEFDLLRQELDKAASEWAGQDDELERPDVDADIPSLDAELFEDKSNSDVDGTADQPFLNLEIEQQLSVVEPSTSAAVAEERRESSDVIVSAPTKDQPAEEHEANKLDPVEVEKLAKQLEARAKVRDHGFLSDEEIAARAERSKDRVLVPTIEHVKAGRTKKQKDKKTSDSNMIPQIAKGKDQFFRKKATGRTFALGAYLLGFVILMIFFFNIVLLGALYYGHSKEIKVALSEIAAGRSPVEALRYQPQATSKEPSTSTITAVAATQKTMTDEVTAGQATEETANLVPQKLNQDTDLLEQTPKATQGEASEDVTKPTVTLSPLHTSQSANDLSPLVDVRPMKESRAERVMGRIQEAMIDVKNASLKAFQWSKDLGHSGLIAATDLGHKILSGVLALVDRESGIQAPKGKNEVVQNQIENKAQEFSVPAGTQISDQNDRPNQEQTASKTSAVEESKGPLPTSEPTRDIVSTEEKEHSAKPGARENDSQAVRGAELSAVGGLNTSAEGSGLSTSVAAESTLKSQCLMISSLEERAASAAERAAKDGNGKATVLRSYSTPTSFLVFLPADISSRPGVVDALRKKGVVDTYKIRNPGQFNGVLSLGLFTEESSANKQKGILDKKGVPGVRVAPRNIVNLVDLKVEGAPQVVQAIKAMVANQSSTANTKRCITG